MVAWAGGKGGPHFFIALADHPEWKHDHTVWAKVVEEDMSKVLLLLQRPLKEITPKQPPRLSYFVTPIEFSVSR
jgi:cyclophilin family peptidyl-prolyl cis-trans isomerase